jgi:hypothetical protein
LSPPLPSSFAPLIYLCYDGSYDSGDYL